MEMLSGYSGAARRGAETHGQFLEQVVERAWPGHVAGAEHQRGLDAVDPAESVGQCADQDAGDTGYQPRAQQNGGVGGGAADWTRS